MSSRLPESLHRELQAVAQREGVWINQLIGMADVLPSGRGGQEWATTQRALDTGRTV